MTHDEQVESLARAQRAWTTSDERRPESAAEHKCRVMGHNWSRPWGFERQYDDVYVCTRCGKERRNVK